MRSILQSIFVPTLMVVGFAVGCGQANDSALDADKDRGEKIGSFRPEIGKSCEESKVELPAGIKSFATLTLVSKERADIEIESVIAVYQGEDKNSSIEVEIKGLNGDYGKNAERSADLSQIKAHQGKVPKILKISARTKPAAEVERGKIEIYATSAKR